MTDYLRERIENWVGEFAGSDLAAALPQEQRNTAAPLLVEFLYAACKKRQGELADVEQDDLKQAMTATVANYKLPDDLLHHFPDHCALLLEHLEREGRLSKGRSMGLYLKSFRGKLNKPTTITRPGSKVGRNDPCPCGSGRKYKRCCMNML